MGIKHFWGYFKKNFLSSIKMLGKGQTFDTHQVIIDNFMIDLNGVFHASTQKIYEYGTHKPATSLMLKKVIKKKLGSLETQIKVFENICHTIERLLQIVNPRKRLILCVDGPAPLSKQNQQRQRRFKAALDKTDEEFTKFDSNCITPGTKFMDSLTEYLDWYIRKSISSNPVWKNIEVVFSSEKTPGEGEHKIINYMRKYGNKEESYCINGLDADLIMLALGTHLPNFWILREDMYDPRNEFFILDIGNTRKDLANLMNWEINAEQKEPQSFNPTWAINDFIFMCFMVGNDFLPHVPSLEIIEGGIDDMLEIYKSVGEIYGHLTENISENEIVFRKKSLEVFFGTIAQYDKNILEKKLLRKDQFFQDELLENNSAFDTTTKRYQLNIEKYKSDYYAKNIDKDTPIKDVCHQYLDGLQWVLSYYTRGVPDWKWCFKHHYAPFAHEIALYIPTFNHTKRPETTPTTPFQQLLSVLPPKSSSLIPPPLCQLLLDPKSEIKKFCPDTFITDISGKRKEWEGIVLLPMVDFEIINKEYKKHINKVSQNDLARNISKKSVIYSFDVENSFEYKSKFGNIKNCFIKYEEIEL